MGDWMSVSVAGSIDPAEAPAAAAFIDIDGDFKKFHCMCFYGPSLSGLGRWIPQQGGQIEAVGNLSERNYGAEDVAEVLRQLVAIAPSLSVKVHCGGEYEDKTCTATVTAHEGQVTVGPPEVETVGEGMDLIAGFRMGQLVSGKRDWSE
jgi:hypothetical protein